MEIKIENNLSANEYNNLRSTIGWDTKDLDVVQNAIKNSIFVKKATFENKTIGMARVIGDGIYYLIVDVLVDSEYQKNGIGKKLIDEIVKEVENKTKKGQKCSINLVSMSGKEKFYEKCGFKKIPFDYTGHGMIKRIEKGDE